MLDMLTHGHESSPTSTLCNASILAHMPLSLFTSMIRKPGPTDAPSLDASNDSADSPRDRPDLIAPSSAPSPPSPPASSGSLASTEEKPKKRAPRPKTTYNLAQPPPVAGPRQKLHLRPKVLLQLHQVLPSRRPKPVYEVIPFSLLATRSNRRLAHIFNIRDKLGPNHLLIVKAKDYDEKTDDEHWGARDVIGIICPAKKDDKDAVVKAEVLMDDGSNWDVTSMPNGGYEFNYTNVNGLPLKSRWVPKASGHSRRVSTMSSTSQAVLDDKKFSFSTISANSRRHPIIATMTRASIDVLDSYNMPTATSPSTPSSPSAFPTPLATPSSYMDAFSLIGTDNDRHPIETDAALRRFIIVSGIWVAFSENWSPAYSLSKQAAPSPLSTSATFRPAAPARTVSMSFIDSSRSASPASTADEKRGTIPRLLRTGSQILQRNASISTAPTSTNTSPISKPTKTRSRRSNSTGTADLKPSGSTRKRFGLALEDQTLPETEEERQSKRSIELLRIKDLARTDGQLDTPAPSAEPSPTLMPQPLLIIEPSRDESRSPSPLSPDSRAFKSRSAYNPVTTTGLWDSGVVDGPSLKARPTSLFVVNEKKKKEKKKQAKSKGREESKERKKSKESEGPRRSERIKQRIAAIFRREKA
ncbi:hypothetical protein EJ04DRAFT_284644 [Polyplosphaeria fusca]|uniref:Uncharacterized protein n=1 Tax=Polyplosphaeria fusca TaxID=682080 RepID=A0A9P4R9Y2_9PLEO|nr:hypothetical protein EJ04DRAFT_284644 [Polyplosphaeria fusca]